jgi:hypothetical protein
VPARSCPAIVTRRSNRACAGVDGAELATDLGHCLAVQQAGDEPQALVHHRTRLAGQLMGLPLKSLQGFGVPAESYGFINKRLAWETVAPLLDRASPLRTAHLRQGWFGSSPWPLERPRAVSDVVCRGGRKPRGNLFDG